jgi:hypothetical protein
MGNCKMNNIILINLLIGMHSSPNICAVDKFVSQMEYDQTMASSEVIDRGYKSRGGGGRPRTGQSSFPEGNPPDPPGSLRSGLRMRL